TSSNDRLYIGFLSGLGFLDESGAPTQRYYDYLDQTQSGFVLAEAIKEVYGDLFAINKQAHKLEVEEVKNKFKTLTQGKKSDKVLRLMANTFRALCDLADWGKPAKPSEDFLPLKDHKKEVGREGKDVKAAGKIGELSLHYNIQIHLPESRDSAVYDAIFRSLKEHLK
ncbi:MAG: DUF5343 domain-containing protein, partial [Candidatus Zixiibacteriota bacterium]